MHTNASTTPKSTKKPLSAGTTRTANARQSKQAIDFAAPSMQATVVADPIFAAIDAHKAVSAAMIAEIELHSALEHSLPREQRRSSVTAHGEEIVETDDLRWIESERAVMRSYDAQDAAACALVGMQATTMAGVIALLQYATAADVDGMGWPTDLLSDDGKVTGSWHYFLAESVACSLLALELRVN